MAPSPDTSSASEARQPSNPSQMVSVNISESSRDSTGRFQLEVSECVETTKTVTTTRRLTRKLPPHVLDNTPTPLECLDEDEFPLAKKPTPPELLAFRYDMGSSNDAVDQPKPRPSNGKQSAKVVPGSNTPSGVKTEPRETPSRDPISRQSSQSPTPQYPRPGRQTRSTAGASFALDGSDVVSKSRDRNSSSKLATDRLRRGISHETTNSAGAGTSRRESTRQQRLNTGVLATPDASELAEFPEILPVTRPKALHLDRNRDLADSSSNHYAGALRNRATSPVGSDSHTIFGSNVATPPITDTDAEPLADSVEAPHLPVRPLPQTARPSIDVAAGQDASLPSPRMSPTLAAARVQGGDAEEDNGDSGPSDSFNTDATGLTSWAEEANGAGGDSMPLMATLNNSDSGSGPVARRTSQQDDGNPALVDPNMFLDAFDSMRPEMKTYMMYQLLRRCSRPTLRVVANAVNPTLKCDFLFRLPLELSYHILSYLNHQDLCRAAQVSKHWRHIVDGNETGWKELFDRNGFALPTGELARAIAQGWGWQDPEGSAGFERDLSRHSRLTSSEQELTRVLRQSPALKTRTSKRKRALNSHSSSERPKRRASVQSSFLYRDDRDREHIEIRPSRSAGPLSAANAAATAVPDPNLGLPSLRQLHLFKSLYRRHHMMRESWTSGKVKPAHVAFAAHPRHVITCLQFDEDKIITGSDDTFIHVYDTKTGKLRNKLVGHEGGVWALQYEGNILVSGSTDRSVRVWDIERGLCQQVFYGHTSTVRCLQILSPTQTGTTPDGQAIMQPEKPLIITGSRDSQLRVWRLPEVGSKRYIQNSLPSQESDCPYFIRALAGHTHSVRAISAYGDTLVSGSYDSTVRVWRISTGECLHVLHGHSQKVYSVVLDHERNRCISGSMDSLVKIWDLATGACLHTLEGHSLLVGLLDLNDDRLVSAAADSTLRIWDPETGRCKNTLIAHTGAITCFQHDGQKVISGSEKTVKMWDINTGECVQDLLTDLTGVWQVKFDGRRCVAAVQRDQFTYVEILDFGAIRDGQPPEELGRRILLNEDEAQAMMDEEV